MTGNSAYNYFASLTSPHISVSALFVLKDYSGYSYLSSLYTLRVDCQRLSEVPIIPGNRYFRLEGKSYYFNRNMPLGGRGA